MRAEQKTTDSPSIALLQQNTPEPEQVNTNPPTLANAIYLFLLRSKSERDELNNGRNSCISAQNPLPTNPGRELKRLLKIKASMKGLPPRIIIAICLFIVATILTCFAPL